MRLFRYTARSMPDGKIYRATVKDRPERTSHFDTRAEARAYKKVLAASREQLQVEITCQQFEDGFQIEDRKIS